MSGLLDAALKTVRRMSSRKKVVVTCASCGTKHGEKDPLPADMIWAHATIGTLTQLFLFHLGHTISNCLLLVVDFLVLLVVLRVQVFLALATTFHIGSNWKRQIFNICWLVEVGGDGGRCSRRRWWPGWRWWRRRRWWWWKSWCLRVY